MWSNRASHGSLRNKSTFSRTSAGSSLNFIASGAAAGADRLAAGAPSDAPVGARAAREGSAILLTVQGVKTYHFLRNITPTTQ